MILGKTILVIEDNPEMMENIIDILQLAHYKVRSAFDGHSGVDMACQLRPDLILCDVMMPDLDGFEVLHLVSKFLDHAMIPFIFLTAKTDFDDMRKGMNLGADDYITKPFDGQELLNVIEMRLQKAQASKKVFVTVPETLDPGFLTQMQNPDFQKLIVDRPVRKYKKKDVVYLEGQYPTEMFFIHSGKVKTFKRSNYGKELILRIHGEGESIGYVPLIGDIQYQEGALALTDAEIALVPKQDLLSTLYSNREIARKFIMLLSHELRDVEKRLVEMAYQSVKQKVGGALLRIYNQYDLPNRRKAIISVSRKDLSNIIGIATESLNRTLIDFRDKGLIEFKDGGILLLNRTSLANLLK